MTQPASIRHATVAPLSIHRSGRVIVDHDFREIAEVRPGHYHGDNPQDLAHRIAHACRNHHRLVDALTVAISAINADLLPETTASLQRILAEAKDGAV